MISHEILGRWKVLKDRTQRKYGVPGQGLAPAPAASAVIARARRLLNRDQAAAPRLAEGESLLHARPLPFIVEGLACPTGRAGRPSGGPAIETLSFDRGAFSAVPDGDCCLCVNHWFTGNPDDASEVLASRTAGTLFLWTDAAGLHYRARLKDTTLGRIVAHKLQRGECRGVSGNFRFRGADTREYAGGLSAVESTRVAEISLLFDGRQPAFPGTSATLLRCHADVSVCAPDFTHLATLDFDERINVSRGRGGMPVAEARRQLALVGRDGTRRGA